MVRVAVTSFALLLMLLAQPQAYACGISCALEHHHASGTSGDCCHPASTQTHHDLTTYSQISRHNCIRELQAVKTDQLTDLASTRSSSQLAHSELNTVSFNCAALESHFRHPNLPFRFALSRTIPTLRI